ncbi:MAG: PIN domain-containing protein [Alysiella sp.]|uniref:PIN domain-containing protein n=1 Tax=Alysiella sp. TaxID=1872483 RepID=UPI0026DC5590|nr:PIN domain-containing protein [Alysiella sp.]MDO4434759.1 PIN domain-containing protein [Alysiella sp.]
MKHLLIDCENIQPQNLDNIPAEDTHIWLFLGVLHKHLPIELVQSLLRFGKRAHLIRLEKSGKNALDFYLSHYLGHITAIDKQAIISILSRDGGYDLLLIMYLKADRRKKLCAYEKSIKWHNL